MTLLRKILLYALVGCLLLGLWGCASRKEESPQEPQGSVSSQAESFEQPEAPPDDLARADELFRQENLLGRDYDNPLTQEEVLTAAQRLEDAGLVIRTLNRPLWNYQKALDFFESEEDGFLDIYLLHEFDIHGERYIRRNGSWERAWIESPAEGLHLTAPEPVDVLRLTENGNLIASLGSDMYTGFRIFPLPEECYDAYWKYIDPIGGAISFWTDDWESPDSAALNWDFIFERLWEYGGGIYLGQSEYYSEALDASIFPADLVEDTLQSYFDVSADTLRDFMFGRLDESRLYHPEDHTYHINGWRGGGYMGTLEVWDVTENPDGTLDLTVALVSLEFGNEGQPTSRLTVRPEQDGSFRYVRHKRLDTPEVLGTISGEIPEKYQTNDRYVVSQPQRDVVTTYLYNAADRAYSTMETEIPDYMLTVYDYLILVEDRHGPLQIERIVYDVEKNKFCVNFAADFPLSGSGVTPEREQEVLFSIAKTILENDSLGAEGVYFEIEMQSYAEPDIP